MINPSAAFRSAYLTLIMWNLRRNISAAVAAVFLSGAWAAEPGPEAYRRVAAKPVAGQRVEVTVDLAASPGLSVTEEGEKSHLLYPMAFNNIAEGWSWQPLADPAWNDYYRYKFLPLGSVEEKRGEYEHEDKIGVSQAVQVNWRYDYFLAFENLYDFYARSVDDDAGFAAEVKPVPAEQVRMVAVARLIDPVVSESTTFWKATYGKPTDFTLKKRYLMGVLEEIRFVEKGGATLAVLRPRKP